MLIETTLGALPVEQLGRIDAHEHIIVDGGYAVVKEPDFLLDSVEKAIAEVNAWKAAGGGAMLDCMPIACGRNINKLVAVSQATGVPIIAATGFQQRGFYLPDHWQHRYDEGELADLMLAECVEGLDCYAYDGPIVKRSPIKAGYLKAAIDYHLIAPVTRKIIRAIGRVHQQTGLPVMVHTNKGTACQELLDLLEAAGVAPNRVMVCHVDGSADLYNHKRIAQRGAFVEYDSIVRIAHQPQSNVVALLRGMFEAGLGEHVLLGGDLARRSHWVSFGGGPGLAYLLTDFSARLRDEGFSEAELDALWSVNPKRWLGG